MSEKVSGLAKLGTTVNIVSIDDIRSEVSDHDYADMMSKSKGWYDTDTDTITIVADNIEDEQDLERTILHEVVAHKGLRDLLGNRFDDTMRKIFDSMDEADQRLFRPIRRSGHSRRGVYGYPCQYQSKLQFMG